MQEDPIPRLKKLVQQEILDELGIDCQLTLGRTLGIDESRMSNLQLGRLEHFSLQKLIRLLAHINRRVDLTFVATGPIPRPPCGPNRREFVGWYGRLPDAIANFGKSARAR